MKLACIFVTGSRLRTARKALDEVEAESARKAHTVDELSLSTLSYRMLELLFRKLERFARVPSAERRALEAAVAGVDTYGRHDVIVRQGDRPSHSCIMLDGFAARFKDLANGKRQILSFQIAGDFTDLHSTYLNVLDHGVEALSPVRIARVPHTAVAALMADFPRLSLAFAREMAADGAIAREWLASIGRRSVYEHAAHLLSELLVRLRAVGLADGDAYELPLTQADLADAFGVSTVHVNRTLQALRRDKLIELKGSAVRILDARALSDVAGFDPGYLQ